MNAPERRIVNSFHGLSFVSQGFQRIVSYHGYENDSRLWGRLTSIANVETISWRDFVNGAILSWSYVLLMQRKCRTKYEG